MTDIINVDFTSASSIPSELKWMVGTEPKNVELKNGLSIEPQFETDFWRNTYYDPLLQAYNGHVFGIETEENMVMLETRFSFKPWMKFDQAGVFMGTKQSDWVKAGVEHVDEKLWQSVVVTRDDYSDWSKERNPWPKNKDLFIRLYRQKNSGVVEVSEDGKNFEFVRIFHLPLTGPVTIGIAVCRPKASDDSTSAHEHCVNFKYLKISKHSGYEHDAS